MSTKNPSTSKEEEEGEEEKEEEEYICEHTYIRHKNFTIIIVTKIQTVPYIFERDKHHSFEGKLRKSRFRTRY